MPTITEQFIKTIEPTEKRRFIMDENLRGFGVRVNTSGYMVYIFRYRIGRKQGTFKIAPVTALTAKQARERARKLAGDVAHGIDPGAHRNKQRETPLFRDFAQQYLDTTDKRSIKYDRQKIDNILNPAWGSRPINTIRENDVRRLLMSIKTKGRKPATINRYRSLISVLFNRAIRDNLCKSNPTNDIKPLPESNERVKWLTDDQLQLVYTALEDEPVNARNAILMCLLTGRRSGDVFSMKWGDVDFENRFWCIPLPKDGRISRVPLPEETLEVLRDQKAQRIAFNPYVFPGRHGNGHVKSVQKSWGRIRKKVELIDFRLHDLRHNYASRLIQETGSLYLTAKLLGHTDLKTTKRYAHLADQTLTDAASGVVVNLSEARKKKVSGDPG